ncbi:cysteine--tRNA ligase [Burkholderia multivorans]|uniref:cysteine--tRNA ligase n=1 Tax=Burkholderia multivorans TaxID=87883 RepID=UPI001C24CD62|nr:cysteine--tRNA ligase [Burkholderia multivorans]MBU9280375.1 cysteine--tRNA ligase [Burkholderia multivorans]
MESLRIYNTLARDKQVFVPRQPGEVRMYVCGITVYDYCHVGHARMLVVFDLVQRWLRAIGYRVTYVRNITDIDDKIIRRAVENGETIKSLTDRFIDAMHEDEDSLGIQRPDIEPRATQFIPQMLGMIERLEANGYAYQATDGDVNYSVRKFANYGKLSGKSLDDLRAGERVAANDAKEDPLDFVLWKRAKADDPEGASWESKYGMGRPGWHIECSAMGCTLLGKHFDIHGGGQDLQFPHHENEIAQSEGATGQTFVNYWLHNGFVQVDNEKMSKSLGNFFTIREVLERYDAEVMRFFIVRTHYRSPLNYSDVHLDDARASLTRLYTALKDVEPDALALDWNEPHAQRFAAAMNDDFNTPVAIATLFELAGEVNRTRDASLARQLKQLAGLLGLLGREPRAFLQQASGAAQAGALSADEIEAKIAARAAAKRAKDYAEADRIRAELLDAGVALEDKPGGSTEWRRV